MKMYDKKSLSLINGMLVSESGDIVMPDAKVVKQANKLETMAQQNAYIASQPPATPMPSLDGFERVSINDVDAMKFSAATPMLDMQAFRSMAIMNELDDIRATNVANKLIDDFAELIRFVENNYVIDCGCGIEQFDTPTIGSVLDLTQQKVCEIIASLCGLEPDDDDDDESEDDETEDNESDDDESEDNDETDND